jgi:hypothetical protein
MMNDRVGKKIEEASLHENQEVRDFREHLDLELRIQRTNYLIVFSLIITALVAGVAYLSIKNSKLEKAYQEQVIIADNFKKERDQTAKESVTLRNNSDVLMKGKIPGLRPFEYNKDAEVDEQYVSRVSFDKTPGKSDQGESYQVRITLFNKSESTVMPDFTLILFDTNGTVTDYMHVSTLGDSFIKSSSLRPNESRTDMSGIIRVADPSKRPAYFAVRVR